MIYNRSIIKIIVNIIKSNYYFYNKKSLFERDLCILIFIGVDFYYFVRNESLTLFFSVLSDL